MHARWTTFAAAVLLALTGLLAAAQAPAPPPSRLMNDLNWMDFRRLVPARIKTVLLTVGTLEPHGVVNNGADNTAPIAIAQSIAEDCQALIAPNIPYGITGSMSPFAGAMHIPEDAFRPYFRAVLEGLVKNQFRNIIVINGHGGPQTAVIQAVLQDVALEQRVNTLMVNWWSFASDVTKAVFGEDGGHAGINETAFIQAINPKLLRRELYSRDLATPYPAPGAWAAVPFPSSIGLYREGEGYPRDFDQQQAEDYFRKVTAKVGALIKDTVRKWQMAGLE